MEPNTNTPEGGAPAATPQQPVQQATTPQQPATGTQPEVSERTAERFNKLTESNQVLAAEKSRLEEANRLLQVELEKRRSTEQQFAPVQNAQAPQEPKVEDFVTVDPVTGEQYVDNDRLQKAIVETKQQATRAENALKSYIQQQQAIEERRQTDDAYKAFPQLNPNTQAFDADLSKSTRAFLIDSYYNPNDYGGRSLTFKEAAERAHAQLNKGQQAPAPQPQQQKATPEQREQASASPQGESSAKAQPTSQAEENLSDLQLRTRKGDMWALAKRLSSVPHTGTPHSSSES